MKPFQTENSPIFTNVPTFSRRVGGVFLVLAFLSLLFACFGAVYFGDGDITSIIIYVSVSLVLALVFSFGGVILVFSPDKKLEINTATDKIILTKKLFRTTTQEFSISDVEKVEFDIRDLENGSIYLPRIILRDGRIIEIPSENIGDEKKQMEIFERVKTLLSK